MLKHNERPAKRLQESLKMEVKGKYWVKEKIVYKEVSNECQMFHLTCHITHFTCHKVHFSCQYTHSIFYITHLLCNISHITVYRSHFTLYMSPIMSHILHVTCIMWYFTWLTSKWFIRASLYSPEQHAS